MMSGRKCIVCGRAIRKRIESRQIRTEAQAARGILGGSLDRVITLPELPRTIDDVRRLTNAPQITKIYYSAPGTSAQGIHAFNTWDGESYEDPFFCTDRCARRQGYAAAQHGQRYVWKKAGPNGGDGS